jgi:hypothetical protein
VSQRARPCPSSWNPVRASDWKSGIGLDRKARPVMRDTKWALSMSSREVHVDINLMHDLPERVLRWPSRTWVQLRFQKFSARCGTTFVNKRTRYEGHREHAFGQK